MIEFMIGMIVGTAIFEPIIINLIYMKKPALFNDIILTKKNSKKLENYYKGNEKKLEEIKKQQKEVIDKINLIIKEIAYGGSEDYYMENFSKINELLKEMSK